MEDKELPSKISNEDLLKLQMAKMQQQLALSEAKRAMSENNFAELASKYLTLQLYMKYNMSSSDGLDDNGNIIRNKDSKE